MENNLILKGIFFCKVENNRNAVFTASSEESQ